jgi:hypothetical protein
VSGRGEAVFDGPLLLVVLRGRLTRLRELLLTSVVAIVRVALLLGFVGADGETVLWCEADAQNCQQRDCGRRAPRDLKDCSHRSSSPLLSGAVCTKAMVRTRSPFLISAAAGLFFAFIR